MLKVTIKLSGDDKLRDASYVSGLDYTESLLFFNNALFLFHPNNASVKPHMHQSLHRIDGREPAMELIIYFQSLLGKESLQVHVMVELSETENPAWYPILNEFPNLIHNVIEDRCNGTQKLKRMEDAYKQVEILYQNELVREKTLSLGFTYTRAIIELEQIQILVKGIRNDTLDILKAEGMAAEKEQERCKKELEVVNKKLSGNSNNQNQTDLLIKRSQLESCVKAQGKIAKAKQAEWDRVDQLLKKCNIGAGDKFVLKSVDIIPEYLIQLKWLKNNLDQLKLTFDTAKQMYENELTKPKRSVMIEMPFQISWLFPKYGGFFFYEGSSPIPPCKARSHVVVLEKLVQISREQFDLFHQVPLFYDTDPKRVEEICAKLPKDSAPEEEYVAGAISILGKVEMQMLHFMPVGKRKVWYMKKNIQFQLDDGTHMRSRLRRKLKKEMDEKNNGAKKIETLIENYAAGVILLCAYFQIHMM